MVKEKKPRRVLKVGPTDQDGDRIYGSASVTTTGTLHANGLRLPHLDAGDAIKLVERIMSECGLIGRVVPAMKEGPSNG